MWNLIASCVLMHNSFFTTYGTMHSHCWLLPLSGHFHCLLFSPKSNKKWEIRLQTVCFWKRYFLQHMVPCILIAGLIVALCKGTGISTSTSKNLEKSIANCLLFALKKKEIEKWIANCLLSQTSPFYNVWYSTLYCKKKMRPVKKCFAYESN